MVSAAKTQPEVMNGKLSGILQAFLEKRSFVLQATVIAGDGSIMASALCSGCSPPKSQALQELLHELTSSYPRPPMKRLIIEDALGLVVVVHAGDNQILIVITEPDVKLGVVSMNVEQLLREWSKG